MKHTVVRSLIASVFALTASAAFGQAMKPTLTLETAKKMAEACEAKARAEGWKVIIAVLDDGANLKYLSRMDGAFLGSIQIAMLKGGTSANFPFSTKLVGEIAEKYVPGIVHVPGLVTFEGGVPIMTGSGAHIGAIGVSGATAPQDGECAQVGLDAVKEDLR